MGEGVGEHRKLTEDSPTEMAVAQDPPQARAYPGRLETNHFCGEGVTGLGSFRSGKTSSGLQSMTGKQVTEEEVAVEEKVIEWVVCRRHLLLCA